jgi:hypothetical protein
MNQYQSTFIAGLIAWLAIASTALGLIARWILSNGPTIAAILEAIKGLKSTSDTHTAQIAANTQAVHQTALAPPFYIPPMRHPTDEETAAGITQVPMFWGAPIQPLTPPSPGEQPKP